MKRTGGNIILEAFNINELKEDLKATYVQSMYEDGDPESNPDFDPSDIDEDVLYSDHDFDLDISWDKHDGGCGDITYDLKLSFPVDGYATDHNIAQWDLEEIIKVLRSEDPDFMAERVRSLALDYAYEDSLINIFIVKQFYNVSSLTADYSYDRYIHLFSENASEIDVSHIQITGTGSKSFKYTDVFSVPNEAVVKIDGYTMPAEFLKKHEGTVLAEKITMAKAMIDNGVPFSEYNMDRVLEECHKSASLDEIREDPINIVANYSKWGFIKRETSAYKDVAADVHYDKKEELSEEFIKTKGRVPGIIDTIASVAIQYDIPTEDVIKNFDVKRVASYLKAQIPEAIGIILLNGLDKNDFDRAIKNQYFNEIAELCGEYKNTGDDRYVNIAKFIISHPQAKPELIKDILKYKDVIALEPDAPTRAAYSEVSRAGSFSEITRIEKKYPGFRFSDCKFDLKYTDVEEGGLVAGLMRPGDVRMATIGYDTHCCQHLGSAGETAMMYGLIEDKAGFFVIEEAETHKIHAQAEIWEKDDSTLVFDNIVFADDGDVSQYAHIIGTFAEKSGYENIYMGNGYNTLTLTVSITCSKQGSHDKGIRQVDGIMPPVSDKFKKIVGTDHPYTDAAGTCSVIKQNGLVELYFSEKHGERLFERKQERRDRTDTNRLTSAEDYLSRYEHINELKEYGQQALKLYKEQGEDVDEAIYDMISEDVYQMGNCEIIEAYFKADIIPSDEMVAACREAYGNIETDEHRDDIIHDGLLSAYMNEEGSYISREVYDKLADFAGTLDENDDINEKIEEFLDGVRDENGEIQMGKEGLLEAEQLIKYDDYTSEVESGSYFVGDISTFSDLMDHERWSLGDDLTSYGFMAKFAEEHSDAIEDSLWNFGNADEKIYELRDDIVEDKAEAFNEHAKSFVRQAAAIDLYCDETGLSGMPYYYMEALSGVKTWEDVTRIWKFVADYAELTIRDLFTLGTKVSFSGEESMRMVKPEFNDDINVSISFVTENGVPLELTAAYTFGQPVDNFKENMVREISSFDIAGYMGKQGTATPEHEQEYVEAMQHSLNAILDSIDSTGTIREKVVSAQPEQGLIKEERETDPVMVMQSLRGTDFENGNARDIFMELVRAEELFISQNLPETAQKVHNILDMAGVSFDEDTHVLMVKYPDGIEKPFPEDYEYDHNLLMIAEPAMPAIEDAFNKEETRIQEREEERDDMDEREEEQGHDDWGMDF